MSREQLLAFFVHAGLLCIAKIATTMVVLSLTFHSAQQAIIIANVPIRHSIYLSAIEVQ